MSQRVMPLKYYPIDQSPLYRLRNRKKLASLFNMEKQEFELLVNRTDNYRVFNINKNTDKNRTVELPKPRLKRLHFRLFKLLSRIQPPSYLHSGVKERSYITNAVAHIDATRMFTLDIKKFFPSTLGWHVYEFFFDVMECSEDVAGALTKLCCYDNHVPTGSSLSQIIAFYAHYRMFENIHNICHEKRLIMTCYVDDIAVSGDEAKPAVLYEIRGELKKRGLKSPKKKEKVYELNKPKVVTGSIIHDGEIYLPNAKHKLIYDEIKGLDGMLDEKEKLKAMERLLGKIIAASQADPAYLNKKLTLMQKITHAKKNQDKAA